MDAETLPVNAVPRTWRPPRMIETTWVRWAVTLAVLLYLVLAFGSVEVNWTRVIEGISRAGRLFAGFLTPDFVSRWEDIQLGMIESLTMTVTSTVAGIALSIPVALGAARNIAPMWLYGICRAIIALARTFQEVIIAIFFVAMFGFGPLAGFLTLSLATVGFLAKLLADDIEEIDPVQVEAIRATGASPAQVMAYGMVPQLLPTFATICVFRWDINIRESTVLGLVGAGGLGLALEASLNVLAWPQVTVILLMILATVLLSEWITARVRAAII